MARLTHLDDQGRARMVDVSEKEVSSRIAVARGSIHMRPDTLDLILEGKVEKGDVFSVARVAGIMAAKKTSELIPMCHPLNITSVEIELNPEKPPSFGAIRGFFPEPSTESRATMKRLASLMSSTLEKPGLPVASPAPNRRSEFAFSLGKKKPSTRAFSPAGCRGR